MNLARRAKGTGAVAEAVRDQATSTFTRILSRLVASTPGAEGAALVDGEGETVDYAGKLDPFDVKVAAAHWMIVLTDVSYHTFGGQIRQLSIRARRRSYFVRSLEEHYAIVVVLHRRAVFAVSERAVQEAVTRLSLEAGWPLPRYITGWSSVEVETESQDPLRRPRRLRVADCWHPVEVMGTLVGLRPREKGYRVRLPNGAEMTLVRERLGGWFTDERFE